VDANTVGAHTYTRRAKDNTCNTTLTQSAGSWVLTVTCAAFNAGTIAATGQTISLGGTPATINSVQNATGGAGIISYQWYNNGNAISGATATSYTPPQADANTAGAHTYTRRAKDNTCNTTLTQSAGSWVLTVCAAFNAGTIAATGQTICSGNAVNTIASSANASGGDGNITYQWRRNGATVSGNAATYSPAAYNTTTGAHTFTRWAHDGMCNTTWTQSAGSWILTVATPQLTLTTGNNVQTVIKGTAITPIEYTATNASNVDLTGALPAGVVAEWTGSTYVTIRGTPAATGTFPYTVTTTNTNGCANPSASGTITVANTYTGCTTASINLGTVGFTSSTTYSRNGLTISSPVTVTYCNNRTYSTFDGGSGDRHKADCAKNHYDVSYGNWFSWCMVAQYALQLCPSPWRVPTKEDHCLIVNGSTTNCSDIGVNFNGVAGYAYTSYIDTGGAAASGWYGGYWSSTENGAYRAYNLELWVWNHETGQSSVSPQSSYPKDQGFALRCVR
jgi:hypothetical protein